MGSPTNEALRGSDETQHTVTISRGLWMEKYLVTQGDYLAMVGNNPSYFTSANGFSDDPTRPVEEVSWSDATNYCGLRTQQERAAGLISANYLYRLPTESEWEYAARAGTTTAFYLGSGLHSGQANFNGQYEYDVSLGETNNPSGVFLQMTTSVGSYMANGWGLYDVIGNGYEWCQDWYDTYPVGSVIDPQGPATPPTSQTRVNRGSCWCDHGKDCRSASRTSYDPMSSSYWAGFRVVLAQSQP
jgi:formylglycine-generating enzyme required for sulfatase activity